MSPENKTDTDLKRHQSRFEALALWSGIAVIAGLAVETWLAIELRPFGEPPVQTWGPILADVLVFGGVFFEIMFGRWALHQGSELQQRAERALAEATERAGKAIERAAAAELDAAQTRLALEQFRAPRVLTEPAAMMIIGHARSFVGTRFDVGMAQGDAEAANFLAQLERVLQFSGWVPINWEGGGYIVITRNGLVTAGIVAVTNVIVAVFPGQVPRLQEAAIALVSALNLVGIAAQFQDATGIHNTTKDAIHILVGRKM